MQNSFTLLGTVAEPLTTQTSQRGTTWANLIVTVNRRYKKDDAWIEDEDTLSLPVFGNRCEWLTKNLEAGHRVHIAGRIGGDQREHNGRTYHDTKLWIEQVTPLGPPQGAQWASGEKPAYQTGGDRGGQHEPQQPAQAVAAQEDDGDDIPF